MTGSEAWVCRYCRSVNIGRSEKCYRCHTPRDVAVARPDELTVSHQEVRPEATGIFRSSETRAVALTIATVLLILASILGAWVTFEVVQLRLSGDAAGADALFTERSLILAVLPLVAGLALLAYASWISRLVSNLPALGLGYSRVSSSWAFFEPFIPGRNLYSLPARTAEVAKKLDEHAGVNVLIGLGWTLVVAPLPIVGIISRVILFVGTADGVFAFAAIATPITVAFLIAGLIVALFVVWRVEALQQARVRASSPAGAAT